MNNFATQFLMEAYSELKQAHWLTREQAIDSTKAVLILVAHSMSPGWITSSPS